MADPSGSGEMQTATLRQRAVRAGALVMVARLTAQIFQWSVTLFVARLLLPDDYGLMTYGTLFLGLADMLAEMGVGKALVQKKELTAEDLAQGFTLSLVLGALFYVGIFFLAVPAAVHLERPEFTLFLRVVALSLLLTPWRSISNAVLDRELHLGRSSAAQLVAGVIQAALVLALAWAGLGYWALACGALVGRSVETFALVVAAGWMPRIAMPSSAAFGLARFGIYISGGALLWFIYTNADFAILGMLFGPVFLGYYSLAFQLISLPMQKIAAMANQVMFPVYCKLQDDRVRLRDWFLRLIVLQAFVATPILTGMALVAEDGIPLALGEQWRPSVFPIQLLCPVGAMMMLSTALPPLFNAIGRPDINLRFTALCFAVFPISFLGAGWLGGQEYGSEGGLVAVCLVWLGLYPVLVVGLIFLTQHLTGVTPIDLFRSHQPVLLGLIVMIASVVAVQWAVLEMPAGVRLAAAIGAGVASYSLWMIVTARGTILADLLSVWRELRGGKPQEVPVA